MLPLRATARSSVRHAPQNHNPRSTLARMNSFRVEHGYVRATTKAKLHVPGARARVQGTRGRQTSDISFRGQGARLLYPWQSPVRPTEKTSKKKSHAASFNSGFRGETVWLRTPRPASGAQSRPKPCLNPTWGLSANPCLFFNGEYFMLVF